MYDRKYSIVMPVYRVENYLRKMASGVQRQTYPNWELIFVDDCSDDRSGEICDELQKEDDRIRVIHLQKNQGLSNARNQGMKAATGEYILFLDSDDWIEERLLERVEDSLQKNPAQMVIYSLTEEYETKNGKIDYKKDVCSETKCLTSPGEIHREVIQLEKKTLLGYAWNKAYQLSLLREKNIQFKNVVMIEDISFNIEALRYIKSINVLSDKLYHYMIRDKGNLTAKYIEDYFSLHVQRIQLLLDLYKEWGCLNGTVKRVLADIYCRYLLSALQRNCDPRSNMTQRQKRIWIKNNFQSDICQVLLPYLSPSNRMLKWLAVWIRHQNVWGCWLMGEGIYIIKNKCPIIFARLKQNR